MAIPVILERKPNFGRAFMPFWLGLIYGVLALGLDYHVRHAKLSRLAVAVFVGGQESYGAFKVDVNGKVRELDSPGPLGFAKITISAPDCEPEVQTRFIFYGLTDLGRVDLAWSRGSLTALMKPTPDSFELKGKRGDWMNPSGKFTDVPVGRYDLISHFGDLAENQKVEVKRNQTNLFEFVAPIGSLELLSDSSGGTFEIGMVDRGVRWTGSFPANYPRLWSGRYRLLAKRAEYERWLNVKIDPAETNRLTVKFVYSSAEISTTPPGALIRLSGIDVGKSPVALTNLVPGDYKLEAMLEGYDTQSREITIEEDLGAKIALTLMNTRYRESMASARRSLEQNRSEEVVLFLNQALAARPGDEEASKMLPEARVRWGQERAEKLAKDGKFDSALRVLDSALAIVPGDTKLSGLQARIQTAKVTAEKKQLEDRYQQAMTTAKTAAAQRDFEKALEALQIARTTFPDRTEVTELETITQKAAEIRRAELLEEKRKSDIVTRLGDIQEAFKISVSEEKHPAVFPTHHWKVAKSTTEVRSALDRIAKADAGFRLTAVETDYVVKDGFTAKMGGLTPIIGSGSYLRIGVFADLEGQTRIESKAFGYGFGVGGIVPDPQHDRLDKRLEKLKAMLSQQLESEVVDSL